MRKFLRNKMAERSNMDYNSELWHIRGMGWTWPLLNTLQNVKRRGAEHGSTPIPIGQAGITPRNWVGTCGNLGRTDTCGRWEEGQIPQGRAEVCNLNEQHPGGLSMRRRRGPGFIHPSPTPTTPPLSESRGRDRALDPHPLHPLRTIPSKEVPRGPSKTPPYHASMPTTPQ